MTKSVPDFALHVLVAAKEHLLWLVAGDQHQHRFRFGKTGEVMKIAVGAILIVRVAVAKFFRRGGNDGNAGTHFFDEFLAALFEWESVHHRSLTQSTQFGIQYG